MSSLAQAAFRNHLWYLSEYCVALAFFDPRVSDDTKRAKVVQLKVTKKRQLWKRFVLPTNEPLSSLSNVDLDSFVNSNTMDFFDKLRIPTGFLSVDPSLWKGHPSYEHGLLTVRDLSVVNDVAERAVALTKSHNRTTTKDEKNFQDLLLVGLMVKYISPCTCTVCFNALIIISFQVQYRDLRKDDESSLKLSHYMKIKVES